MNPVSPATRELLSALDALSSHSLLRRDDLGILFEAAATSGHEEMLDTLSFEAKFVSQSVRVLDRIGPAAREGERLRHELSASLERVGELLRSLFTRAGGPVPEHFADDYLALRPDAAQNLITLCHDLRWYKNLQIDLARKRDPHKGDRQNP